MGKYAFFIWGSYIISGIVLGGLTLYIWSDLKRQAKMLQKLKDLGAPKRPRARAAHAAPKKEV